MQKKERPKQAYERPEVRRIKLVGEELAAAGCKTPTSKMGPMGGCFFSMCKVSGS
jgi:hypothetical protein